MATDTLFLRLQFNRGRANAMMQATVGQLRRAPRNKRPGIVDRAVKAITATCVRVTEQDARAHVSCDCMACRPWTT